MAQAPHCDDLVLHAPGNCKYCDMFPDIQQARIKNGVNFTGENDPKKKQCPAEVRRSLDTINRWGGNVAHPEAKKDDCGCSSKDLLDFGHKCGRKAPIDRR